MRIKKTMSQEALDANRINGSLSPGPVSRRGKNAMKYNAAKRGLLAKGVILQSEERRAEFEALMDQLEQEIKPKGMLQRMLVEEIGVCWWKLQIAQGWALEEIQNRRRASKSVIDTIVEKSGETRFPLFQENESSPPTGLNWDCDELFVRSSSREQTKDKDAVLDDPEQKIARLEVTARLSSPLETISRYETRLKRDLYKAIQTLRSLQAPVLDGRR